VRESLLQQDKAPVQIDELALAVGRLAHDRCDVAWKDRLFGFDGRSSVVADTEEAKRRLA
jgi:hypothetical protein